MMLTGHFKATSASESLIYLLASNTGEVLVLSDQKTWHIVYCELNIGYVVTVL